MNAANPSQSKQVRELATQLYRDRHDYLSRIARHNAATQRDAEDALQEAFASFLRAFDPSGGAPPLAWLTLTLKRECWAARRGEHVDRRLPGDPERDFEDNGVESIPSRGSGTERLVLERIGARARLGRLRPDQRTALGFLVAGFSYREVAERRGWTYTKVNRCVSEGRAALKAQIAG